MTSESEWLERVVAWRKSGQSAARFCEGASYDASSLRTWSSRLGREGKVARAPLGRRSTRGRRAEASFARVVTCPERAPRSAASATLVVAIGASRIEVGAGFDRELLRSLVAVLAEGAA